MAAYNYINAQGVIIPDTSTIKDEVEAEYKSVYGADFVVDSSTEQGRQIDAEITSRMSVVRNNAAVANQINPNLAESNFLDAIYALSNGERDQAERSTVICTCTGVQGAIIPKDSRIQDINLEEWAAANAIVIPASGTVDASFISVNYGPIIAAIGEVNIIIDGVLGWETVNNSVDAVAGKLEQNDVSTRRQRKIELAGNAVNNTFAIMTAISALENVASLSFRENYSDSILTIDGVIMGPNSTYVCVDGGVNLDIATAYYKSRSGGSGFNGDTAIIVTDPNSLQEITVQFDRPDDEPKLVRVTVKAGVGIDPVDSVKKAVVNYANGLVDGEAGFVVGGNVSAFEIAAAVNDQVASIFVDKCEIAENTGTPMYTTDTIETEIFQKASVTEGDVQVIVL